MIRILPLIVLMLILCGNPLQTWSQLPLQFNYQGIARNTDGLPLVEQKLRIRISLAEESMVRNPQFVEDHEVRTNTFGLYTLKIGAGQSIQGSMQDIAWATGEVYMHVQIDPEGGTKFVSAGISQLLSVPFALYAAKTGDGTRAGTVSTSAAGTGTVNYLTKFMAANTIYNSQLFDNGTNIGLGTNSPAAKFHIYRDASGFQEHLRMQNVHTAGAGRFTMYNDGNLSYATFTKYGSAYAGGYAGITTLYPLANLLAFGNNAVNVGDGSGRFLISTAGNAGISLFKSGVSKLKFHADFLSENVGLGGSATPVSRIHFNNTDANVMDLRLTHNSSGHTINDGLLISESATKASINNLENQSLSLGTNGADFLSISNQGNVGVNTTQPSTVFQVTGSRDTLSYFTSDGNSVSSGIVRAEYTGTALADHIGVYARVLPDANENYGVGVYGEGGYTGIQGLAKTSGLFAVYGLLGEAAGRDETFGLYAYAHSDTIGNFGTKYGLAGMASNGLENIGVYGEADGTGANSAFAGYFNGFVLMNGDLNVLGNLSKGGGTFQIDHPLDPANKFLYHSFVESPDMMNIYNGNAVTGTDGKVRISLPEYFEALNQDFRYQLTVIGERSDVWVSKKVEQNVFEISTEKPHVEVSWQVTGIRKDAWAMANRVVAEVEKPKEQQGKYLYPQLYGQSASQGIFALRNRPSAQKMKRRR